MTTLKSFEYGGATFEVRVDPSDLSGVGCIREIVTENEYFLDKFKNIEGKYLFDIGANCGIATVVMAKLNPLSTVYSFEPFKPAYDVMCQNILLNNLTNVKTFNKAVMNTTDKLMMMVDSTMSGANSLIADEKKFTSNYTKHKHVVTSVETESVVLDEVLTENKIDSIEVLKIDCEGGEYEILYGSEKFRKNIVKNIVGEFHDFNKYMGVVGYNGKALIDYCNCYVDGFVKLSTLDLTKSY